MVEVLERGDIGFFFRPSVQPADAPLVTLEVQRFFLVLSPAGGREHRRLRVGRKRLPKRPGERCWGTIERVGTLDRVLSDQMESERYETKTRGARYQPGARPIAQGCYAFVRHDDHCHLAYRADQLEPELELPEGVSVPEAGSLIVLWKRQPPGRATWTTEGDPHLLDDEGAELVLVGNDETPEEALGVELVPGWERREISDGRAELEGDFGEE